jgi:thioredoxin 1
MATIQLTKQGFKEKVFDYEQDQEWKYKGTLPAIIDFYADWCGPCKMVAPILDELAKEYDGKLTIYKVDTEAGAPMLQKGAIPKNAFKQVIEERLLQKQAS